MTAIATPIAASAMSTLADARDGRPYGALACSDLTKNATRWRFDA